MKMNVRARRSRRAVLLAGLAAAAAPVWAADENAIAVVVRQDVPVDNLSFAELRRLVLGDRQYWSSNLRVTLLMRAPGARERDVVLKTIYQMSEAQFRQYWIAKVFRAEAASGPRTVYSNDMAEELAGQIPGAVAFVTGGAVAPGLKVLKINGLLPRDPGYPLH
jgi:ABC-type phosphate transport system substrate-binding protein